MKPMVTAVVVTHDADEYLEVTLRAVSAQTIHPDRIILVNTGADLSVELSENIQLINLPSATSLDQSLAAASENLPSDESNWIWILHDDDAPEPDCLEQLLLAEEKTGLAGAIAPKQMRWSNPRVIHQLGLTLTPFGTPISLVTGELDQSQHDSESDVLAAGTAGLLVRADLWKKVGGLPASPPLAADYELCIRLRLEGARVLVAPNAKIRHAALSMSGERSRRWLGGKTKLALRKAAIHLRMVYAPLWLALLYWILLPLITIGNVFWRLFQKRPDRIASELAAGLWGFFTLFARLRARHGSVKQVRTIRKAFDASWSRVRAANRSRLDDEYRQELGADFSEGSEPASKSFIQSGGLAWMALLLAFSYQFFPLGEAAVGGGSIPLGINWSAVFSQTGVSWQRLGFGFAGPSDPFNWVLLLFASLSPTSPSSAVTWFLFIAPTLAFFGAWRTAGLLNTKAWARNLGALVYSVWPAFIQARADAQIASTVACVALPWLAFAVARAAGLGRSGSSRSMRQTWSWVGLSGLLLAIVGVASPILTIPILIALAATAFTRIKRFVYLFWIPLPLAALVTPLAYNLIVVRSNPLAIFADPGIPSASKAGDWFQGLMPTLEWFTWGAISLAVLALLALLTKRWVVAFFIWIFIFLTVAVLDLQGNTEYFRVSAGIESATGSIATLSTAAALLLVALLTIVFEHSRVWLGRIAAFATLLAVVAPMVFTGFAVPRGYEFKDDRVVPWLLESTGTEGAGSKLLKLEATPESVIAQLEPVTGLRLENQSLSYQFAVADLNAEDPRFAELANLAADLSSGSTKRLKQELESLKVNYVLVAKDNLLNSGQLSNRLDSIPLLEAAGLTEFGKLWRVKNAQVVPLQKSSWWSITKGVQIAIVVSFLLLAIPTTARKKQRQVETFDETEVES